MDIQKVRDLGRLVHSVHDVMARIRAIELHKLGLTSIRVDVLSFIKESNKLTTISAIASRIARELNTVTELLKRMEKDGFIRKVRQKRGHNLFTILLTEKGEEAYLKAMQIDTHNKILSALSQEEQDHCASGLEKLRSISFEELHKLINIPTN